MNKLAAAAHQIESVDFDRKAPDRYTLDAWQTPTPAHEEILRQIRTNLTGLLPQFLLCGGPGAGKTHLAHGMALAKIIQHADRADGWNPQPAPQPGEYGWTPWRQYGRGGQEPYQPLRAIGCTYFQLVETINADRKGWRETRRRFLAPILMVDEIRKVPTGTFADAALDELFNLRYKHRLFTIFISNLTQAGVFEVLGERMQSRFGELGGFREKGAPGQPDRYDNYIGFRGIADYRLRLVPEDPIAPAAGRPVARRDSHVQ